MFLTANFQDIRVSLSGGLSLKFDGLYLTVFIEDSRVKLTYDGAMSLTLTLQNPRELFFFGIVEFCCFLSCSKGFSIRSVLAF